MSPLRSKADLNFFENLMDVSGTVKIVLADKQTASVTPIPDLAGSGTTELELHSIHSCAMHLIAA